MNWYILYPHSQDYVSVVQWAADRGVGSVCNLSARAVFVRLSDRELTLLNLQWNGVERECYSDLKAAMTVWQEILDNNTRTLDKF